MKVQHFPSFILAYFRAGVKPSQQVIESVIKTCEIFKERTWVKSLGP